MSDGLLQFLELLLVLVDHKPGPFVGLQRVVELLGRHAHLLGPMQVLGLQLLIEFEVSLLPMVHGLKAVLDSLQVIFGILSSEDRDHSRYEEELVQFFPGYSAIQLLPV